MLVHCPKCGFQQPDDQYCARCGIDMKSYKPSQINQSKKMVQRKGLLQIVIFILIAAATSFWLTKNKNSQTWVQKFNVMSKSTRLQSHDSGGTAEESHQKNNNESQIQIEVDKQAQLNALAHPQETTSTSVRSSNDTSMPIANMETRSTIDTAQQITTLKLSFIEIPKTILMSWMAESQSRGLFQNYGDFSAGILIQKPPQFDQQTKSLKSEVMTLGSGKLFAHIFGKTTEDTGEINGLQTQIEIKSKDGPIIKGHFSVTKTVKNSKESIPSEFELQKGHVFFILWKSALSGFEDEVSLFKIPPFQVIQSPEYLNQRTEFVILIEPQ